MDSLSATFAALSDETRRQILARLRSGPASVHELAEPFNMSQQAVSKHLAYLERAQLIHKRRSGREHICSLAPAPLRELSKWTEQYRQFWDHAFEQLGSVLHELHPQTPRKK